MELRPGARLRSSVCTAEFVVVRPAKDICELKCGGQVLVITGGPAAEGLRINAALSDGIHMGKRYFDEASGLELLASKAGLGTLTVDGRVIGPKETKALPASD